MIVVCGVDVVGDRSVKVVEEANQLWMDLTSASERAQVCLLL